MQADCLQWLKNNDEKFDVVFIDPPTFSNSKRMGESFDVQRDHVSLITDGMKSVAAPRLRIQVYKSPNLACVFADGLKPELFNEHRGKAFLMFDFH